MRKRPFLAGFLSAVALVSLIAAGVRHTRVPDLLALPLLLPDTTGQADAIVVPGAGVGETCVPNLAAIRRTMTAVRLLRQGRAPLVLFTGGRGPNGGPCPTAEIMADLARNLGADDDSVLLETASRTTWENALRSAPILRARGVERILLVTDCLHMRRAEACFRTMGFEVERASIPATDAYCGNASMLRSAAHEYLGIVYYRLKGYTSAESTER